MYGELSTPVVERMGRRCRTLVALSKEVLMSRCTFKPPAEVWRASRASHDEPPLPTRCASWEVAVRRHTVVKQPGAAETGRRAGELSHQHRPTSGRWAR